ncbi:MAG TPA: cell division protein ZapE [Steroidobacteraceae bacterium]
MSPEPQPIAARLAREIAAHRLEFDSSQAQAAVRLDELRVKLLAQSRSLIYQLRARLPWLPDLPAAAPIRGVYLWGGVGRGKTLLMDFFYESLRPRLAQRTHFYRFMREVHLKLRSIKNRTDPLDVAAERLAARAQVICLDEFFVSDIADAMILAGLFEGLFQRGVTLVATSNIPPQDLYKDGLQRQRFLPAIDLLEAHLDVVQLDGSIDYRLRQLEQAPTYLDSTLTGTPAKLAQRFAALAGGGALGPAVLSVEDRPIAARATGAGMVWFDFKELCEGPRSQNDYIEIARVYHTVFLSNIPEFRSGDDDAARRFIMLIDEFYDRNVNVVVSAAAAPAALYHGDALQMEFSRAASRLVEMQTQAYLARQHRP